MCRMPTGLPASVTTSVVILAEFRIIIALKVIVKAALLIEPLALEPDGARSFVSAWIEFANINPASTSPNALPALFDWIKERSAQFRGALLNTILRNDTFHFSQLGTFLERADNTSRILDVKYYVLLPQNSIPTADTENLLVSCRGLTHELTWDSLSRDRDRPPAA